MTYDDITLIDIGNESNELLTHETWKISTRFTVIRNTTIVHDATRDINIVHCHKRRAASHHYSTILSPQHITSRYTNTGKRHNNRYTDIAFDTTEFSVQRTPKGAADASVSVIFSLRACVYTVDIGQLWKASVHIEPELVTKG